LNILPQKKLNIEGKCNKIAAELLIPQNRFLELWRNEVNLEGNAEFLSRKFKISRAVVARAALDTAKIQWDEYRDYLSVIQQQWESRRKPEGGNYYANTLVQNGKRFTRAVVNSAMSGDLLLRDAGDLLRVKPAVVCKLSSRFDQESG
jgi:Zn-dependent peptidase ImmA (M78 family)